MKVTPKNVADQLAAYLHHELPLAQLVKWAEDQMMNGELADTKVRDAVARLGLADVRSFGLSWDDCQELLHSLGFTAKVEIGAA